MRARSVWVGGINAVFGSAFVFVKLLAVSEAQRDKDVGRRLLAEVEAEARRRDHRGIWLDTYAFQAPGFYRLEGYDQIGEIEEYFPGMARHFFAKRL